MRKFQSLVLLSLLFFIFINFASSYALYGSSSPVLQLTPSNFKSKVLNSNGVVLVEFFAPWCGHCKALTPTWEKAATVLKGVASVAALDADAHQSLAQEYGIGGFPTIKVFSPGKPPVDYQGARDVKSIAEFALKQVLNSNGIVLVEFFAPWCGHCKALTPTWEKAATVLKGVASVAALDADAHQSLAQLSSETGEETVRKVEDELKVCKNMIKCTVCYDRLKEVVIVKCCHMFCSQCIQRNLELRHRKCPACGTAFGQSDVRFVKI